MTEVKDLILTRQGMSERLTTRDCSPADRMQEQAGEQMAVMAVRSRGYFKASGPV